MSGYRSEESTRREFEYSKAFFEIMIALGWSRASEAGWFMPRPEGWN